MQGRQRVYKTGNFMYKLLSYIPVSIDRKAIETCVKTRNKSHLNMLFITKKITR